MREFSIVFTVLSNIFEIIDAMFEAPDDNLAHF